MQTQSTKHIILQKAKKEVSEGSLYFSTPAVTLCTHTTSRLPSSSTTSGVGRWGVNKCPVMSCLPKLIWGQRPSCLQQASSTQQCPLIVRRMSKITLVSHNDWRYSPLKSTATEAVPLANSIMGVIHPSIMITVRFSCVIQ